VSDLSMLAAGFTTTLRAAGIPVSPERGSRFAQAVVLVSPATTNDLYWTARVTLTSDRSQLEVFDRVFRAVFASVGDVTDNRGDTNAPPPVIARGAPRQAPPTDKPPLNSESSEGSPSGATGDAADDDDDDTDDFDAQPQLAMSSNLARSNNRDFASCTAEELERIRALIAKLRLSAPLRESRRTRSHRRGNTIDMRATLRAAQRTGGDPYRLARRSASTRPRRVVLLADVSGSMEPYARAYLTFLHGAVRALRAEAFVFATSLTRLTRPLRLVDPDVALTMAMYATPDWSGGTRLGEALSSFNNGWGRRGLARGAVVVIVSDGWGADDPEIVSREMERLHRLVYRVVWVNPRLQNPQFQPLVGAMAAALPFVDSFISGHSLAAMQQVADAIALASRSRTGRLRKRSTA
jgi:uncharacterized protein